MNVKIDVDEYALDKAAWELYDGILPNVKNDLFRVWLFSNSKQIARQVVIAYLAAAIRNRKQEIGNDKA